MWINGQIAWRYFWRTSQSGFVTLTIRFAMIGILLGVAVLIAVSSIMNGFDYDVRTRLFDVTQHITIVSKDKNDQGWLQDQVQLSDIDHVTEVGPFIQGHGLFSQGNYYHPLIIKGVMQHAGQEPFIHQWLDRPNDQDKNIKALINQVMFDQFDLKLHDSIVIYLPRHKTSFFGMTPQRKSIVVDQVFDNTLPFLDKHFIYVSMDDARQLFQLKGITGMNIMIDDPMRVEVIAKKIEDQFGSRYNVQPWTERFTSLFDSLKLQKNMMLLVFSLIIMIASFNLVSGLVMITNQKRIETAVLRTMGCTRRNIFTIYLLLGLFLATVGIILGIGLGLLLSHYATEITQWIESLLGIQVVTASVFMIDYLPTRIIWSDVAVISGFAWLIALLSVLYPAWSASRIAPAEVLRYE
ncbi:MAG: FtsX-like permease family protein [Candidatus Comchoanobacterales bacterium]